MKETWRAIEGYQDYEVSDLGRVRSWRMKGNTTKPVTEPRLLSLSPSGFKQKYRSVKLYKNNRGHSKSVHRLVLEAFAGPMPEGMECLHKNGDPVDNRLDNLRYGTHIENMADQKLHGTASIPAGERHGMSRLTEDSVRDIRQKYSTGNYTHKSLGLEYNVHHTTIGYIIRGKLWKHIL